MRPVRAMVGPHGPLEAALHACGRAWGAGHGRERSHSGAHPGDRAGSSRRPHGKRGEAIRPRESHRTSGRGALQHHGCVLAGFKERGRRQAGDACCGEYSRLWRRAWLQALLSHGCNTAAGLTSPSPSRSETELPGATGGPPAHPAEACMLTIRPSCRGVTRGVACRRARHAWARAATWRHRAATRQRRNAARWHGTSGRGRSPNCALCDPVVLACPAHLRHRRVLLCASASFEFEAAPR